MIRRLLTPTLIAILFTFSMHSAFAHHTVDIDKTVKALSKKSDINTKVLKHAVTAYKNAERKGLVKNPTLTVIDYSKPSSEKRMWIFDVEKNRLSFYTHVAHGVNSGGNEISSVSNVNNSRQTSVGTFITKDTYSGSNGYSLNLEGLEKGFNDNAYARRIVIHGANYADESFVKQNGRLGRSWGCPAVSHELAKPVIDNIKGDSVVVAYYPDKEWLKQSEYLTA